MDVSGKRIFVGLSGGVDSAVSAALLQEAGAEVTGVFIKGWYPPDMPCTWRAERQDAMRVAAHLHLPFRTLDASAEYKKHVIDYLLAEYAAGRTPNPDVMCNREIKFGVFYRNALAEGAEAIATGHYRSGEKDQSYFLALVPKEILEKTIFPVGDRDKSNVRGIATRLGLPVAEKKDSQGVCFLGNVSIKEFLAHELGTTAAVLHTIGERVEGKYVVGKQAGKLILSSEPIPTPAPTAAQSSAHRVHLGDVNWLRDPECVHTAQYRYRGPMISGRIVQEPAGLAFEPNEPLGELPAPGQLLALYEDAVLAGGAIIESYV